MKFMSETARPTRQSPMTGPMNRAAGLTSRSERKSRFRTTSSNGVDQIQPVTASCSCAAADTYSATGNPAVSDLFQKSQQTLASFAVQGLGVQRPVMIRVCCTETLLDHGEIFVLGKGAIVVGIGSGQLFRSQSACQLSFVERAFMVAV